MILRGSIQWLGDKISVTFGSFLLDGDWPQLKVNKLYCGFDMTLWIQLVAGCHFYFNCSLDSLVSLCASKTNGLNPNRTWKQLTFPLSRILINNSLYCLPNNSYNASSDNLVLDQLIIPLKKHVFLSCHECETKKKFWVPMRNWTSDLRIPCSDVVFCHQYTWLCTSTKRETVKKYFKYTLQRITKNVLSWTQLFMTWLLCKSNTLLSIFM